MGAHRNMKLSSNNKWRRQMETQKERDIPKEFLDIKSLVRDPMCPLSEKAVRFHVWRSGVNGLAPAVYRIGRKILIKRSEWVKWLESHAQKKTKH
jgi:hypothetical protein